MGVSERIGVAVGAWIFFSGVGDTDRRGKVMAKRQKAKVIAEAKSKGRKALTLIHNFI